MAKNEITVVFNAQVTKVIPVRDKSECDRIEMQVRDEVYRELAREKILNAFCADDVLIRDLKVFVSDKAVSDECEGGVNAVD